MKLDIKVTLGRFKLIREKDLEGTTCWHIQLRTGWDTDRHTPAKEYKRRGVSGDCDIIEEKHILHI